MKEKSRNVEKSSAVLIWGSIFILFALGVSLNFYFSAYPVQLRLIGWLILLGLAFVLFLYTPYGQRFKNFASEAKSELRKVVWPTRQEAVQATLSVVVMAVTAGFILWLVDVMLIWVIGKITV